MFFSGEREDWAPLQFDESMFEFLNRNSWPITGLIRDWVNEWAKPFDADPDFISKFKSKKYKQHAGACMEMLIFALLTGADLPIKRLDRSKSKTPDFIIKLSEILCVYLECTLAASAMEDDEDRQKIDAMTRWFEEIDDYPFVVGVMVNKISDESISKKQLFRFLNQYRPPFEFLSSMFEVPYKAQGWDLTLTLIRKSDPLEKRTKAFRQTPAKTINNFIPLYTALNDKKPSKYGIVDSPYVICVGVDDMTANEEEFFQVLYGAQNPKHVYLDLNSKGFFINNGEPVNTSVSAVLFCKNIKLFGLSNLEISLWHNPFAIRPIQDRTFPFRSISYRRESNALVPYIEHEHISTFDLLRKDKSEYMELRSRDYTRKGKDRTKS
jgi:hypothetical protein